MSHQSQLQNENKWNVFVYIDGRISWWKLSIWAAKLIIKEIMQISLGFVYIYERKLERK